MATTQPGGAYQDSAGAWHDSNGAALTAAQVKTAKKQADLHDEETAAADAAIEEQPQVVVVKK